MFPNTRDGINEISVLQKRGAQEKRVCFKSMTRFPYRFSALLKECVYF